MRDTHLLRQLTSNWQNNFCGGMSSYHFGTLSGGQVCWHLIRAPYPQDTECMARIMDELFYWRKGDDEVDFILRWQKNIYAIEVNPGRKKKRARFAGILQALPGTTSFYYAGKLLRVYSITEGFLFEFFLKVQNFQVTANSQVCWHLIRHLIPIPGGQVCWHLIRGWHLIRAPYPGTLSGHLIRGHLIRGRTSLLAPYPAPYPGTLSLLAPYPIQLFNYK